MTVPRKTTITFAALVLGIWTVNGANGNAPARRALPAPLARPSAASKQILATTVKNTIAFAPETERVKVGTKVTWLDKTQAPHTVTGTGAFKFKSKTFNHNGSASCVFKQAGTFHYECAIHPFMTATIVVTK
jgi:plastocyanin